jgi:hypothetical protein
MTHKLHLLASAAIGVIALAFHFAEPVHAGTCQPVTVKASANDPATATTRAQVKLTQKAAQIGGRVTQTSTDCIPGPTGTVCKIKAVVCPSG